MEQWLHTVNPRISMAPHRKQTQTPRLVVHVPRVEVEYVTGEDGKRHARWLIEPHDKETAEKLVWRPILCSGFEEVDGQKLYHHLECTPCHCTPGPHYWALATDAFEIGCGGGRGSGKSEDMLPFFAKGDPRSPNPIVHATYLNHPKYTFLVLRKNSKDLKDFFERAKAFFKPFGGQANEQDMLIKFPSGAYGVFDHLMNENAAEKYQGHEWTRLGVDEVEHIASERQYLRVLMSCRVKSLDLKAQAMVTFNPGGPGARWIRDRFVNLKHEDGRPVRRYDWQQQGEVYSEPFSGRTRVFVFSRVEDNPYKMLEGYDKQLDMLNRHSQSEWRRWRLGDFTVIDGQFFEGFRSERRPGEPEEALHVVEPRRLEPWWPRAIGCDWGFSHSSAVNWGCWSPRGQLNIYRELGVSRMGTVELGAEIARLSLPDLEGLPNHHLNLYLSHDCFHRDDIAPTEAEQIGRGVAQVLGRDAAFIMAPTMDEETLDPREAYRQMDRRRREMEGRTYITIIRAARNSGAGWNEVRELMRWWPLEAVGEFDPAYAKHLLVTQGQQAYHDYARRFEKRVEVLPKLLIWKQCVKLIASIEAAEENPNNTETVLKQDGDDPIDALQYLVAMFKQRQADVPKEVVIAQKLERLREAVPGIGVGQLIRASEQYEREAQPDVGYLRLPRVAGPARRRWAAARGGVTVH